MIKKLANIGGTVVVSTVAIPNGLVLAFVGMNEYTDFLNLLEYGLQGLIEYFKFIIEMYETALEAGAVVT